MFKKICIIGVGLIGGSIARASRANGLAQEIVGVGRQTPNLQRAVELGVIDSYELDIATAVGGADLVVLCTPVGTFEAIFKQLKPVWSEQCLYTDAGSTKQSVIDALKLVFKQVPVNFVAAHPIAGSENSGVEASKEDLFIGKRAIITAEKQTAAWATKACEAWWQTMGAKVSMMDVQHHDEVFAATSHLPHILAYSLVELLKNKQDEREIFEYAAGGFKDFTRIASSDPEMWSDICLANGSQLVKLMQDLAQINQQIVGLIEANDKQGLLDIFKSAQGAREYYLNLQET
ncbi:prephenate dehydrogenase [Cycloclasticus sp. 46_120_T64]|nr:prephenate dehydrogenase [Cycloclasticus sp. 46_120_T64]